MIEEAFSIIKSHNPGLRIIYGGSVNESNIRSLKTGVSGIAGVLVGSASLDADGFARMLDNVMECL
ncbi:triosephosphate isomerase family protein [Anaplasma phagocytophilum str. ApMUC09]|nr:triosephosphate isomerase family protein [Anaplasma phagocytophilum str. ApMUC09]